MDSQLYLYAKDSNRIRITVFGEQRYMLHELCLTQQSSLTKNHVYFISSIETYCFLFLHHFFPSLASFESVLLTQWCILNIHKKVIIYMLPYKNDVKYVFTSG